MKAFISWPVNFILIFLLYGQSPGVHAYQSQIERILNMSEAPEGVVIEVISRDRQHLDWALVEIYKISTRLRGKFPALDIAIVSHGPEQFALQKNQLQENTHLDSVLDQLRSVDVDVHVCGTYAEYKGVSAEEFSPKINVAAEGPAQIRDYKSLGYIHIKLKP